MIFGSQERPSDDRVASALHSLPGLPCTPERDVGPQQPQPSARLMLHTALCRQPYPWASSPTRPHTTLQGIWGSLWRPRDCLSPGPARFRIPSRPCRSDEEEADPVGPPGDPDVCRVAGPGSTRPRGLHGR